MLKKPALFTNGHHIDFFPLNEEMKNLVLLGNWARIDEVFKGYTKKGGELFNFLQAFHEFNEIEFIISIRDGENEWEEDGIWHDDGSRVFAFSLSLTLHPTEIEGGHLGIRKKGSDSFLELPTPNFGNIILFLTGVHGYEHKIHQVKKGKRIIIAGWCS